MSDDSSQPASRIHPGALLMALIFARALQKRGNVAVLGKQHRII